MIIKGDYDIILVLINAHQLNYINEKLENI